jgi:hypothetical protein
MQVSLQPLMLLLQLLMLSKPVSHRLVHCVHLFLATLDHLCQVPQHGGRDDLCRWQSVGPLAALSSARERMWWCILAESRSI